MMRRQHKIAILKYVSENLWVLLFPAFRGVISLKSDFFYWLKGTYLDIIVIVLALFGAYLRWNFIRYEIGKKGIYVRKGALFRKKMYLPFSAISAVTFHTPLYLRPFKAVKISFDSDAYTLSERRKTSDVMLVVGETDCSQIIKKIPNSKSEVEVNYKTSKKEIAVFSMLFSSTLSGVFYLITLVNRGSKIVGEKIEMNLLSAVDNLSEAVNFFAEGAASFSIVLTMLIIGGWLISFVRSLLHHICFEVSRCGNRIEVERGYFSHWKYYVNYSRINYADLRQNPIMKLANVTSVYVNCTGYGKGKNETSVFIPVTTKKRVKQAMKILLPDFTQSNNLLTAKRVYIWLPLVSVVGVPIAAKLLCAIFPEWGSVISFLGVMLEVLLVYLLAVKVAAMRSTGIGVSEETLTVSYCKAYRFHTVIIPKAQVAYIKIRRTPFQRAGGFCDVTVFTKGERVREHLVRGVAFKEAEELVRNYDKMR